MPKEHGMTGKKNAYKGGAMTIGRSISFPKKLLKRAENKAKRDKTTVSKVVVTALETALSKPKKE